MNNIVSPLEEQIEILKKIIIQPYLTYIDYDFIKKLEDILNEINNNYKNELNSFIDKNKNLSKENNDLRQLIYFMCEAECQSRYKTVSCDKKCENNYGDGRCIIAFMLKKFGFEVRYE